MVNSVSRALKCRFDPLHHNQNWIKKKHYPKNKFQIHGFSEEASFGETLIHTMKCVAFFSPVSTLFCSRGGFVWCVDMCLIKFSLTSQVQKMHMTYFWDKQKTHSYFSSRIPRGAVLVLSPSLKIWLQFIICSFLFTQNRQEDHGVPGAEWCLWALDPRSPYTAPLSASLSHSHLGMEKSSANSFLLTELGHAGKSHELWDDKHVIG